MRYPKLLLIIPFLFSLTTTAQESHDYFFQEVGWSITLPYDFTLIDPNDYSMGMKEDTQEMDDTDLRTDNISTQTIFIAIKDRFNHFSITITPFDPELEGSWEKENETVKEDAYKTMEKIIGKEKIDTASSIEYIDGLMFKKFQISVSINNEQKVVMFLLSRWYKGYDLNMAFLNINDEAKEQVELMLKSSRFH